MEAFSNLSEAVHRTAKLKAVTTAKATSVSGARRSSPHAVRQRRRSKLSNICRSAASPSTLLTPGRRSRDRGLPG